MIIWLLPINAWWSAFKLHKAKTILMKKSNKIMDNHMTQYSYLPSNSLFNSKNCSNKDKYKGKNCNICN